MFVLARVTVKSFKGLPGMEGCQVPPDSSLLNSNVYSTAEAVLLAWMTAHYYKVSPAVQSSPLYLLLTHASPWQTSNTL